MLHSPFIMIDEKSGLPIYRQIYETIRRSILSGELRSGRPLPPSRSLAEDLKISRMTVVNAYEQLLAEGYIESRTGAGTFVAEHLPDEFLHTVRVERPENAAERSSRRLELSRYGKSIKREDRAVERQPLPVIPFQHGLTAMDQFPFDIWTKIGRDSYHKLKKADFGYGDPAGYYPLRAAIAAYLKAFRAVNCTPEQIIVTAGAQDAFDLIGRLLLEPKTKVWFEDPGYIGARQVFEALEAKLIPVPIDEHGFDLSAARKRKGNAALAYVTPSHQFPLGMTMSLSRRLKMLEWARAANAWIIEDDYDSEFRYEGRPLASLQGLDRDGRVLYIGTFSKMIFPALRLGCVVVPSDMAKVFVAARALSGSYPPVIDQATLAEFINDGHFTRHIRRMRKLYETRQGVLVAEVRKHLAGRLEVKRSVSGMHLVGWLGDDVDDRLASQTAARFGVKAAPISGYSMTKPKRGGLILGYTGIDEKQIKKGVRQLTLALDSIRKAR